MPDSDPELPRFQKEWHRYYSRKRIAHQWLQVHLLAELPVRRVLEIGPHLGLVSAMLCNAGYDTVTLDIDDRHDAGFGQLNVERLRGDVLNLDVTALRERDFDAVLCCETLEHVPYDDVPAVLDAIADIGAGHLVLSVPFMGSQLALDLYVNRFTWRKYTSLKKFMGLKRFRPPVDGDGWEPHKWELGYRDYPLTAFREVIERRFEILRTEFTEHCRSAFFLCANRGR